MSILYDKMYEKLDKLFEMWQQKLQSGTSASENEAITLFIALLEMTKEVTYLEDAQADALCAEIEAIRSDLYDLEGQIADKEMQFQEKVLALGKIFKDKFGKEAGYINFKDKYCLSRDNFAQLANVMARNLAINPHIKDHEIYLDSANLAELEERMQKIYAEYDKTKETEAVKFQQSNLANKGDYNGKNTYQKRKVYVGAI